MICFTCFSSHTHQSMSCVRTLRFWTEWPAGILFGEICSMWQESYKLVIDDSAFKGKPKTTERNRRGYQCVWFQRALLIILCCNINGVSLVCCSLTEVGSHMPHIIRSTEKTSELLAAKHWEKKENMFCFSAFYNMSLTCILGCCSPFSLCCSRTLLREQIVRVFLLIHAGKCLVLWWQWQKHTNSHSIQMSNNGLTNLSCVIVIDWFWLKLFHLLPLLFYLFVEFCQKPLLQIHRWNRSSLDQTRTTWLVFIWLDASHPTNHNKGQVIKCASLSLVLCQCHARERWLVSGRRGLSSAAQVHSQ